MQTAILLSLLASVNLMTAGWTRRRGAVAIALLLVGFLGAGGPVGSNLTGWLAAGLLTSGGMLLVYSTLLRADLTMVPVALGTMLAIGSLARGMGRRFPARYPRRFCRRADRRYRLVVMSCAPRARARAVVTSAPNLDLDPGRGRRGSKTDTLVAPEVRVEQSRARPPRVGATFTGSPKTTAPS
jgi:hypothetical protein